MSNNFELSLVKKESASEHDAYSFYFDLKGIDFSFSPGQYIRMILDKPYQDERGKSRFFSVASSPTERDHIMITTRIIKSEFKKTLAGLKIGERVKFMGPFGKFIFDEWDTHPRVFIAGGIGITPFRSMVKYAIDKNLSMPITVFASFSTYEDIIYRSELEELSKKNPNIQIVTTITKSEGLKIPWNGERGRLNPSIIQKYVPDFSKRLYFIAGPEGFVTTLKTTIAEMDVKDGMIIIENFPGY